MELDKMWLDERSSTNPLRIPHPKIDKLACQAQGVGIFAIGEISLLDAYCAYLVVGILVENCRPASENSSLKIPKKRSASRLCGENLVTVVSRFRVSLVMPCCGARNFLFAVRSQNFDRCHSLLLASSATGSARKRPHFAYPTRRSTSSLVRRRVWVSSP